MKIVGFSILLLLFSACNTSVTSQEQADAPYILVLGVAQDAGYPQTGCEKACCQRVYANETNRRYVSCIAVVDPLTQERWIFDATPDFPEQLKLLNDKTATSATLPDGIFITHAHIGHYTGLMHLGREAMGTSNVPVYMMPEMEAFIKSNGPWSQLVELNNISVQPLKDREAIVLNDRISVTPMRVPHRDEYSETVGYEIQLQSKKALFIPDINKWQLWDEDIVNYIKSMDVALLDATFFADGEIQHRAMSEIPHPFVSESMALFDHLSDKDKAKVHFIHFNHTNPLLIDGSDAQKTVLKKGYQIARQGQVIGL